MSQIDEPTPPGGPQRQDAAGDGVLAEDEGADRTARESVEGEHGGTVEEDRATPDPAGDLQEENAETSLDQPSEG